MMIRTPGHALTFGAIDLLGRDRTAGWWIEATADGFDFGNPDPIVRAITSFLMDGAIEVTTASGERTSGGDGTLFEFAPGERHAIVASSQARLLLLLTPWPGTGHPGAMTFREKLYARRRAAKQAP